MLNSYCEVRKNDQLHLVINEFMARKLAKLIGLDVADVELRYFDQFSALILGFYLYRSHQHTK
ncbi:hypothetical protein VHA01S_020_00430 [Vibrio halioticoli NBRC 102217]|uniref:Uncharacterized protein n=1 Tax=Vibrio halioticoli NBRC 102217 TaxID=1219072 RepID=V5HJM6_9VIBR|nr:hypothetical protein VHA01S_020_00430 [Vibrio halioticoli NBRC 102217]